MVARGKKCRSGEQFRGEVCLMSHRNRNVEVFASKAAGCAPTLLYRVCEKKAARMVSMGRARKLTERAIEILRRPLRSPEQIEIRGLLRGGLESDEDTARFVRSMSPYTWARGQGVLAPEMAFQALPATVRRARIAAGIKTVELAKFLGVTRSFVAQRELGFKALTPIQAARFLDGIKAITEMRAKALIFRKEVEGEISE
jgi:hypothetical protein